MYALQNEPLIIYTIYIQFMKEYLQQYKVPSGVRISDGIWKELLSEVVDR